MRRTLPTIAGLALLGGSLAFLDGAQQFRAQEYTISAAELSFDLLSGTIETTGDAHVESQRLDLRCTKLKAKVDQKAEKLLRLEAQGNVSFTTRETIKGVQREVKGSAQSAVLDTVGRRLTLSGGSSLHVSGGDSPAAHIAARDLSFDMSAEGGGVVAEGKVTADWGGSTITGQRLEAELTPNQQGVSAARITGGVVLTGAYLDKVTKTEQPVRARGQRALWTEAGAKAVLTGEATVDFEGGTKYQEAHLEGEEITVVLGEEPGVKVTRGAKQQATVKVTTADDEQKQATPNAEGKKEGEPGKDR